MISSIAFRYAIEKNLQIRLKICGVIQCGSPCYHFQLTVLVPEEVLGPVSVQVIYQYRGENKRVKVNSQHNPC